MDGEVQQAVIKSNGASEYYEGFAQAFGLTLDVAGRKHCLKFNREETQHISAQG